MTDRETIGGGGTVEGAHTDLELRAPAGIPDWTIDGYQGIAEVGSLVRLNLFRIRADPATSSAVKEVVGTLTMTRETVASFARALADWLESAEKRRHSAEPKSGEAE